MYEEYWGLTEKPFENTADPRFLYYAPQHEEAFTRLSYAVNEQKGASLLTGVFGCGKTVIAQALINSLNKAKYEIAFIVNPQLSSVELLREIVYDLGIKDNLPTLKTDIMHLLKKAGKRFFISTLPDYSWYHNQSYNAVKVGTYIMCGRHTIKIFVPRK